MEKIILIQEGKLPEVISTENVESEIENILGDKNEILNTEEYLEWKESNGKDGYVSNPIRREESGIVYIGGGEYCEKWYNRAVYAVGNGTLVGGLIPYKQFIICSIDLLGEYQGLTQEEIKMMKQEYGIRSIDYIYSFKGAIDLE